jgi:hypothetical protein
VSKRRLVLLVTILVAAGLAVGAGQLIYRVFLAPTQAVVVDLDAAVNPQAVAKEIAGSDAVAYHVEWCGGASPSPDLEKRLERTYYVNIKRGGEAQALHRARQIPGVWQAWLDSIPGPCPNNLA